MAKNSNLLATTILSASMAATGIMTSVQEVQAQEDPARRISVQQVAKNAWGKNAVPLDSLLDRDKRVKAHNMYAHLLLTEFTYDRPRNYYVTKDGWHFMVNDLDKQSFVMWDPVQNDYDTLRHAYVVNDTKTGFRQIVTYDEKQDMIDFHVGGTNSASTKEMREAGEMMFRKLPSSSKVAIDYMDKAIVHLKEHYPNIDVSHTGMRFSAHSRGCVDAFRQMTAALVQGYRVDEAVFADPYGLKCVVNKTSRMLARISGIGKKQARQKLDEYYQDVCTTIQPKGGSFVGKMPFNMDMALGQTVIVDTKGPAAFRHSLGSLASQEVKASIQAMVGPTPSGGN